MTVFQKRIFRQWLLLPVMVVTILFGWRYPLLGFSVPIAMLAGVAGGFFRGRYVCGNWCPRGAFFDRVFSRVSGNRPVPAFFRGMGVRWVLAILMIGFMVFRLSLNPVSGQHWGRVFWVMCLGTTVIGFVLAKSYNHRGWCSVCPVGTMANAAGRGKYTLKIADSCISCGKCVKACPMAIKIPSYKQEGTITDPDCLRCGVCIPTCPVNALSFPTKSQS